MAKRIYKFNRPLSEFPKVKYRILGYKNKLISNRPHDSLKEAKKALDKKDIKKRKNYLIVHTI